MMMKRQSLKKKRQNKMQISIIQMKNFHSKSKLYTKWENCLTVELNIVDIFKLIITEISQSYLPGIVSIKAQDQAVIQNQENQRVGVDLICLIDKSGSMNGQKIEMVKQTLALLLDFLNENDRYQLITFESQAQRLTPLKRVTDGNKQYNEKKLNSYTLNKLYS